MQSLYKIYIGLHKQTNNKYHQKPNVFVRHFAYVRVCMPSKENNTQLGFIAN